MIKLTKTKSITIFAVLMLCLNILLVTKLFFRKPPIHKHIGPKNIIIEKLSFDKKQVQEYDILILEHQAEVMELKTEILESKAKLYQGISLGNEAERDSLIDEIGRINKNIEYVNYEHFLDIEALCTLEQLPKFEVLKTELSDLFKGHMMPPKK